MRDKNENTVLSEIRKAKLLEKNEILGKAIGKQFSGDFHKRMRILENKPLAISLIINVITIFALLVFVIGGDHRSPGVDESSNNKPALNNDSSAILSPTSKRKNISPIKYGFNAHVHAVLDSPTDNMTLNNFKKGVDILASNNLDIVRLDLRAKEITGMGNSPFEVRFNDNILIYDEAIRYAKDKGLNVFLVTNLPEFAANYSNSDYQKVTADFYTKLISRYSDKLGEEDVIQVFNEPNKHSYRDHAEMNLPLSSTYLRELSETIETAGRSIKSINNKVLVTTNLSYWVGRNEDLLEFGPVFFDEINGIDVISLNLFPDHNEHEIARLPEYIRFFSERYQKPVYLAEIGLPTLVFTQSNQADSLDKSIDVLQKGEVRPAGIIVHELFDVTSSFKDSEKTFGIYYSNGTPKQSALPVINAMLNDESTN